jgi:hypothetical protein
MVTLLGTEPVDAVADRQVTETKGAHARLTYLKTGYRNDTNIEI